MKQHIMALLEDDEKRQTALQYWKEAIAPYIQETDNIDLIIKCLSKHTWTKSVFEKGVWSWPAP